MNRKLMIVLALAAAAGGVGCTPPKVLVANSVQSKYVLQQSPTQGGKNVYNFIVRICDAEGEKSVNCRDSVVLENVIAHSVY